MKTLPITLSLILPGISGGATPAAAIIESKTGATSVTVLISYVSVSDTGSSGDANICVKGF